MDPFTVVPIASLTKAFFSQTAAICEHEKKFTWVTPIKNILPDFRPESETLFQKMTMVDALSHRAGIENPFYWAGCMNDNLIPQENNMAFINGLKQVGQFRGEFRYCNPGYDIAARALNTVNGAPWNDILHSRIFQPLSMSRTSTDAAFRPDDNVAKPIALWTMPHPSK
jgi:CubicO group peptidase (beta-lactamase class C family)